MYHHQHQRNDLNLIVFKSNHLDGDIHHVYYRYSRINLKNFLPDLIFMDQYFENLK